MEPIQPNSGKMFAYQNEIDVIPSLEARPDHAVPSFRISVQSDSYFVDTREIGNGPARTRFDYMTAVRQMVF